MFFGLILVVASALGTKASFLLKARGAVAAPPVRARHPHRSGVDLFRSRWFAIGWIVAVGAWLFHLGALALAPLSITQPVLSGGLVFLAVLAERFFGVGLQRPAVCRRLRRGGQVSNRRACPAARVAESLDT